MPLPGYERHARVNDVEGARNVPSGISPEGWWALVATVHGVEHPHLEHGLQDPNQRLQVTHLPACPDPLSNVHVLIHHQSDHLVRLMISPSWARSQFAWCTRASMLAPRWVRMSRPVASVSAWACTSL